MNSSDAPFVSVLTPVYNGEQFLVDCIESVLKQTYRNFEYIIVNNCSTDRTLEIAQAYAAKDSRIKVVTNQQFVAVIANHNIAFNLMSPKAKYCKIVSADDYIFEDHLEKTVAFAEAHPSVGIVGSYQISGAIIKWQGYEYPRSVFPGRDAGRRWMLQQRIVVNGEPILGFGTPTSLLYRADLVRETREFYPNPSPHSDTSACFSTLQKSDFGFVYQTLSYERTHEATQSSTSHAMDRYSSAVLNDLIQYGHFYLTDEEFEHLLRERLRVYHRYLARNFVFGRRNEDFWSYHKGRLAELGYPLSRGALFKAVVLAALSWLADPASAARKIREITSARVNDEPLQPAPNGARPARTSALEVSPRGIRSASLRSARRS
jgi:glycosyltransferase involved in cell wall biosynthesis